NCMSINPNGTAEEIVLDFSMQRSDQLLRSFELERDHVDDNVRIKASNPRAEFAFRLFGPAVHANLFDDRPGWMRPVGCRLTAANVYTPVPTPDKRGQEVGSDMSPPSNDDDPSHSFLLRLASLPKLMHVLSSSGTRLEGDNCTGPPIVPLDSFSPPSVA